MANIEIVSVDASGGPTSLKPTIRVFLKWAAITFEKLSDNLISGDTIIVWIFIGKTWSPVQYHEYL